jgi:hypothetical protein
MIYGIMTDNVLLWYMGGVVTLRTVPGVKKHNGRKDAQGSTSHCIVIVQFGVPVNGIMAGQSHLTANR